MKVIILILNFVKIIGVFPRLIKLTNVIPVAQSIDNYFLFVFFLQEKLSWKANFTIEHLELG